MTNSTEHFKLLHCLQQQKSMCRVITDYWDYGATNNDSDIISMTMIVITSQITGEIILDVLIIT
jgi:predicted phosphohydrolase